MWLVVFTGCLEVAGYICHLIATESVDLTAYICNLVFIIMAPNFLALANYVCVGKVAEQLQLSGAYPCNSLASILCTVCRAFCLRKTSLVSLD